MFDCDECEGEQCVTLVRPIPENGGWITWKCSECSHEGYELVGQDEIELLKETV